jgi:hypothetical protein
MLLTRRSRASRAARRIPHIAAPLRHTQFTAHGAQTVTRLRQEVRMGNVLRIRIGDEEGRTLIEIPSLLGIRGGHRLAPVWAAVRALASVSGQLTVEVSREAAWPPDDGDYVTEWDPRLS